LFFLVFCLFCLSFLSVFFLFVFVCLSFIHLFYNRRKAKFSKIVITRHPWSAVVLLLWIELDLEESSKYWNTWESSIHFPPLPDLSEHSDASNKGKMAEVCGFLLIGFDLRNWSFRIWWTPSVFLNPPSLQFNHWLVMD